LRPNIWQNLKVSNKFTFGRAFPDNFDRYFRLCVQHKSFTKLIVSLIVIELFQQFIIYGNAQLLMNFELCYILLVFNFRSIRISRRPYLLEIETNRKIIRAKRFTTVCTQKINLRVNVCQRNTKYWKLDKKIMCTIRFLFTTTSGNCNLRV
jgi:hypothetical protein